MPRSTTLMPDYLEESFVMRGVTYRLRELSIGEYDDLVKLVTTTKPNPITGEVEEITDNQALLRFMILKCVVEPKLSAEALSRLPVRVNLKLGQLVNRMHYGDEPTTTKSEAEEEPEEEEAKGND